MGEMFFRRGNGTPRSYVSDGLVANFDGYDDIVSNRWDSKLNGHYFTLTNVTKNTSRNCMTFPANNASAVLGSNINLGTDMTIQMVMSMQTSGQSGRILEGNPNSMYIEGSVGSNQNGGYARIDINTNTPADVRLEYAALANVPITLTFVKANGVGWKVYINNSEVGVVNNHINQIFNNIANIPTAGNVRYYHSIRLYNKALSRDEVMRNELVDRLRFPI